MEQITPEQALAGVVELVQQILDVPPSEVTASSVLTDLGADSLATAELGVALEERFGVAVPDGASFGTVADVVALVAPA